MAKTPDQPNNNQPGGRRHEDDIIVRLYKNDDVGGLIPKGMFAAIFNKHARPGMNIFMTLQNLSEMMAPAVPMPVAEAPPPVKVRRGFFARFLSLLKSLFVREV